MVGFSRSNFLCILNTFTALLNTSGLYNAKFVNLRVNISWLDLWHRLADLSGYEFWDSGFWLCELLCLFGDDLCFLVGFSFDWKRSGMLSMRSLKASTLCMATTASVLPPRRTKCSMAFSFEWQSDKHRWLADTLTLQFARSRSETAATACGMFASDIFV